jgi:hypothetical protein
VPLVLVLVLLGLLVRSTAALLVLGLLVELLATISACHAKMSLSSQATRASLNRTGAGNRFCLIRRKISVRDRPTRYLTSENGRNRTGGLVGAVRWSIVATLLDLDRHYAVLSVRRATGLLVLLVRRADGRRAVVLASIVLASIVLASIGLASVVLACCSQTNVTTRHLQQPDCRTTLHILLSTGC